MEPYQPTELDWIDSARKCLAAYDFAEQGIDPCTKCQRKALISAVFNLSNALKGCLQKSQDMGIPIDWDGILNHLKNS